MDRKLSLLYAIATRKANVLLGCITRSMEFRSQEVRAQLCTVSAL